MHDNCCRLKISMDPDGKVQLSCRQVSFAATQKPERFALTNRRLFQDAGGVGISPKPEERIGVVSAGEARPFGYGGEEAFRLLKA